MFDHFFDIESTPIGSKPMQFVLGYLLDADGAGKGYKSAQEDRLVEDLLSCEGRIWSHNGGRFDLLWLSDHLLARGVKFSAAVSGSRVVRLSVGAAHFCDSAALFKMRLSELTSETGTPKEVLGLPCRHLPGGTIEGGAIFPRCALDCLAEAMRGAYERWASFCKECEAGRPGSCERKCKGFCWCFRGSPKLSRILDYCERDTRSLAAACLAMEEFSAQHGIELGITVGSTGWKTAQKWLELPDSELSFAEHRKLRKGLYGGRCQVFRPRAAAGHLYDVRSMYPWALGTALLPWGKPEWTTGDASRDHFSGGHPGFFRAVVDVPPMWIPPLPARSRDGRNAFPTGRWDEWWDGPRLRYAEALGVSVRVTEAATWPEERQVFKPWADKLFELRRSLGGKTPRGKWVKFILNSLTGKLAARPEKDQIDGFPGMEDAKPCRWAGPCAACGPFCFPGCHRMVADCGGCCRHHCSGRCGAHRRISAGLWARVLFRLEACTRPEWAGYLYGISGARVHALLIEGGSDDACYTDTDCCRSLQTREGVGENLGDLEHARFRGFEARAPKLYGAEDQADGETGWKRVWRAKGFPVQDGRALRGEAVGKSGMRGFRTGAREGAFFASDLNERKSVLGYGDRILDGEVTRAPTVDEANVIGRIGG